MALYVGFRIIQLSLRIVCYVLKTAFCLMAFSMRQPVWIVLS